MQKSHRLVPGEVKRITVHTFHEAVRLNCRSPGTTEEAQYSLPFPLAAALFSGRLGVSELTGSALNDPQILQLSERVELVEDKEFNRCFPSQRFARVEIETDEGGIFESSDVEPVWEACSPPADSELREKFKRLSREQLAEDCASELELLLWDCAKLNDLSRLLTLMTLPANKV